MKYGVATIFFLLVFASGVLGGISLLSKRTHVTCTKLNANTITSLQLQRDVGGLGAVKAPEFFKERDLGQFKSARDFEERMEGKLSQDMIYLIQKEYIFEEVNENEGDGST